MSIKDPNIAARFAVFRKHYVAKGMVEAGKLLGCSQSKISEIESGKRDPDFDILKKLILEYGLNTVWLVTGRTLPQMEVPTADKPNTETELETFKSSFELQTANKVLNSVNQTNAELRLSILDLTERLKHLEVEILAKNPKS